MSGPADFKSTPGFENQPRFLGVIEQNKILNSFVLYTFQKSSIFCFAQLLLQILVNYQNQGQI